MTREEMNVEVKKINYDLTKPFILGIHYARRMPCVQYAYGLFVDNELTGVVTYGQPASPTLCKGVAGEEHRKDVLELNRLVLFPKVNGKNYASILVGRSLKMLPHKKIIVSYADCGGWGHVGYVYQATNFLYTGATKPRTDKYGGENGHSRHYDKNETRRQPRTAKHRYIYITGSAKEKRRILKDIKYKIYDEYPKGESEKYDVHNPEPKIKIEEIK